MSLNLYHVHHQSYQEDIPFWISLAEKYGDPILEMGCGSGRVLLALAHAGFTMYGVDNDATALKILSANRTSNYRQAINYWLADMTAFEVNLNFPLIIMPCNTYSTLSSQERAALLKFVRNHLSLGGAFVVSVPNPSLLVGLPEIGESEIELIITHPESGDPVQVSSSWSKQNNSIAMHWHYDHLKPNGNVVRTTASTMHYMTTIKSYKSEFEAARLTIDSSYGDFDSRIYREDSKYAIFVLTI